MCYPSNKKRTRILFWLIGKFDERYKKLVFFIRVSTFSFSQLVVDVGELYLGPSSPTSVYEVNLTKSNLIAGCSAILLPNSKTLRSYGPPMKIIHSFPSDITGLRFLFIPSGTPTVD